MTHLSSTTTLFARGSLVMVAFYFLGSDVMASNLLPDPSFTVVSELGLKAKASGWNWQCVEEPSKVHFNQGEAVLQGGKVFLHSMEFAIEPGTIYELTCAASGTAKLAVEVLWWKKDRLPTAAYHRSILSNPHLLTEDVTPLRASIRSPADAATAYIRFAAEEGRAVLESPGLKAVGGELLLKLDAAAPGTAPQTRWQDLTGRNKSFALQSVQHSPKTGSYVFARAGASCRGNSQDAGKFDFETDQASGPGRGSPFTVVLYAMFRGRSGTGIVNKMVGPTKGGWSIGLEWDEFGLDRVATIQQSDKKRKTLGGFPGLAGDGRDIKLNARDDRFHLFVIHLTGSGRHDGRVYFDGSAEPLTLTPWPWGGLSSGSVRNDAPLRIGSFSENGFRGEIGFVEIWSGSRLQDGRTPAEYSQYRYNQGAPIRPQ